MNKIVWLMLATTNTNAAQSSRAVMPVPATAALIELLI